MAQDHHLDYSLKTLLQNLVPADWKDESWSPWQAQKILEKIYGKDRDRIRFVTTNIHYSELPELLRAKVFDDSKCVGNYLWNFAYARHSVFPKASDLTPADRHAKWVEVGETESKETLTKSKMNVSPTVLYEMAIALKRICRLKNVSPSDRGLTALIVGEVLEVLMDWVSPSTRKRWGVKVPPCWKEEKDKCTARDVSGFCEKLLHGIRRDQVRSIVEHFSEGAGFGSRPEGVGRFDIKKEVDKFIEAIPAASLDEIIFTSKLHDLPELYMRLNAKLFLDETEAVSVPPENKNVYAKDGMQCYPPGTPCKWSWGSYVRWGKSECGCWDHLEKWHECDLKKCS